MWLVDRKPVHKHTDPVELGDITTKQAALIGPVKPWPLSLASPRSGATIVSGLMTGLNRPTATAFSFYLAVPIMIAATGYKMLKYRADIAHLPGGLTRARCRRVCIVHCGAASYFLAAEIYRPQQL